MALSENLLEEIIFSHPECFFPDQTLRRYARQLALGPRASGSRIDIAFEDTNAAEISLFEVKAAGKVTLEVVRQVERYLNEARVLQATKCECPFPTTLRAGVIAPAIPAAVRTKLSAVGITCHEFPEEHFLKVANEHGISLLPTGPDGLRLRYWTSLDEHLRKAKGAIRGIKPTDANGINVVSFDGLQLTFRCSTQHNCLDVDLTFTARGAHHFPRFCAKRADVDLQLGQTVLWFKQGTERHIRVQHWANVRDESAWPQFHDWMRSQGEMLLLQGRRITRGY